MGHAWGSVVWGNGIMLQNVIVCIALFFLWTLLLYVLHRVVHRFGFLGRYHMHHHRVVNQSAPVGWHWSNLFLWNDDLKSTVDLWTSEVIPTLLFSAMTGAWWISVWYYVWASLIQERIEHNEKVNVPVLTSGAWHLIHHKSAHNYGLFTPLWDVVFRTYRKVSA